MNKKKKYKKYGLETSLGNKKTIKIHQYNHVDFLRFLFANDSLKIKKDL